MNEPRKQSKKAKSTDVAENSYHPSDYDSSLEVEQGLSFTHEQVSDAYVEGTVDGQIDEYRGKNIDLPKEGFNEER
ncbi:YozQ family protein [Desertibacillus haloalkaliphilus]|uniref:YozQ family protein n=1 Tax=Desertibacillus haloalkaliphilus TaxID=1328930 RepID=UPI001C275A89|nr:YozQ family protein [Desertibacillus haloalkaliphilus]MBU8906861.1 YozQ family protein [Desertibacillus haloalkaliphilus]